jgi:hypothetical protein
MFSAHYDIRIGWNERGGSGEAATAQPPAVIRRVKTVAGCYFIKGDNEGPVILEDSAHAFTKVTWTNLNQKRKDTGYVFSFDWSTGKLTITATAAGRAPAVRIVDPPDDFEELRRLLPDL